MPWFPEKSGAIELRDTLYFTISKFLLFSGLNCEIDVSICNATTLFGNRLKPHCSNGGQCIDGLGAEFYCECPTGKNTIFILKLKWKFDIIGNFHVWCSRKIVSILLISNSLCVWSFSTVWYTFQTVSLISSYDLYGNSTSHDFTAL